MGVFLSRASMVSIFTLLIPAWLFAASAPYKVVYTFGGLNERSGILWVARDAGIFRKYGIDPTIVNVRNAQVGMSALAGSEEVVEASLSLPFAETTATATAVPIATVARAPPPTNSSLRRLLRVSDASASAAQSGVWSAPLFQRC